MLRRTASIALAAVSLALVPSTAGADTPRCVSKREFNRVTDGMAKAQVHRIFDTAGRATGLGAPNELRHYRPCATGGVVQVTYSPAGRVVQKSGNWLN